MTQRYRPPIETVATGQGVSIARASAAILACALVAALFGGQALLDWTEALPIHWISDLAVTAAAQWRDATQALGLAELSAATRRAFRYLQNYHN